MKIFYFTSTGNSLEVAKAFDAELISIPQVLNNGNLDFSDDAIGIVFPSYYFGVPRIVKEFISKVKLKSNYIFAIVTCGNKSGATSEQFVKLCMQNGVKVDYTKTILMVDNYLPIFEINKQLNKLPTKKVDEKLAIIKSDVESRNKKLEQSGSMIKLVTFFAQQVYKTVAKGTKDKKFIIEDSCTGCGICANVCPVNNIKIEKQPIFQHHCDECLACIHHCPQNSIHLKGEKSRARFINGSVSLKEIVLANK